jgi:hypothetical protein
MSADIDELIMAALCVSPFVAVLGLAVWALMADRKVGNE